MSLFCVFEGLNVSVSVATLSVISGMKVGIRRLSEICFGLGKLIGKILQRKKDHKRSIINNTIESKCHHPCFTIAKMVILLKLLTISARFVPDVGRDVLRWHLVHSERFVSEYRLLSTNHRPTRFPHRYTSFCSIIIAGPSRVSYFIYS